MIRYGLFSKYAKLYDHSQFSPIKASVDVWRYSNATRRETLGTMEHRLEEIANDLWDEHFDDGRHYERQTAYTLDTPNTEHATTALNISYRYHVYVVDIETGGMETIAEGVKKW